MRGGKMEKSIGRLITLLARKSQIYLGNVLSKYDLTAAEQPFFMALQRYEGITQEELTAVVCVDKAVTTRVVRSLEEKGYLIRLQDEKDRRQNRIYPTKKAKQLAPEVREELGKFNDMLTEGIDTGSRELICRTLLQMEENLTNTKKIKDEQTEGKGKYYEKHE